MVNGPDDSFRSQQYMAALAVSIVGDIVEQGDALKGGGQLGALAQGEIVLLVIGLDEKLHRANAEWPVAQHHRRDVGPAQRLAEQVGCCLTAAERAGVEIPQRAFAFGGLVHRQQTRGGVAQRDEKGIVRTPRELTLKRDLAVGQQIEGALQADRFAGRGGQGVRGQSSTISLLCPLRRGHKCPSGSMGRLQSVQIGRPWATTSLAWWARARICPRLTQKRATAGF